MKTILTQNQHDMGLFEPTDGPITKARLAARGVITNDAGQVAVMYFTTTGSYKLPGGGVDEGEDIMDAFHREIKEETGYLVIDAKELGIVEEDRYFCGLHQTSYCFMARATEFVGTELTEGEKRDGMQLRWVNTIDEAVQCIEQSDNLLEGESAAGLAMMKAREAAILRAASLESDTSV